MNSPKLTPEENLWMEVMRRDLLYTDDEESKKRLEEKGFSRKFIKAFFLIRAQTK